MDPKIVAKVQENGLTAHIKDVFIACCDQIITRKVTTVSGLMDYLDDLTWRASLEKVARKCFRLIQEMHWGIFRDLVKSEYPKLWRTLVIPDRRIKDIGTLKRDVQVQDIYCALMDIRAYTDFCHRHRHNLSMLNVLDGIIQKDMNEIAHKHGCLSQRSAGDNILVVGSSAGDLLRTCLGIVDCFSRRRVINSTGLAESRQGKSIVLQDIQVTAGIAGGQNYSSLVVTRDGNISGSVVNTASRLQGFANYLSPERSKVMISAQVHSAYLRETRNSKAKVSQGFDFFACGKVHFKGVGISVYEVLYAEQDMKKLRYQKEFRTLLSTLNNGAWKDRLVLDIIVLVVKVLTASPVPRVETGENGQKKNYTNNMIIGLAEHALGAYTDGKDHHRMNERLGRLLAILEHATRFDRLVLEHLRQIVSIFDRMTREFESIQYEKIMSNQIGLFSEKEKRILDEAARLVYERDRLIERGKQSNNIYSAAMLWSKVISDYEKSWEFEVYSGKR